MKPILILTSLLCISNLCLSQDYNKGSSRIGITYSSFGENQLVHFQSLDGAASYDSDNFFTVGLSYLHPINNWLSLEVGLEYSEHTVIDFSIINFPISMRALFLKYFFFNSGLILDIDISEESKIDAQTGIGGLIGIGVNYDFAIGVSAFVNPYVKAHSLISFSGENYPLRLLESGLRIGITYKLNRKQKI